MIAQKKYFISETDKNEKIEICKEQYKHINGVLQQSSFHSTFNILGRMDIILCGEKEMKNLIQKTYYYIKHGDDSIICSSL